MNHSGSGFSLSRLVASLQGPDGILSFPWETGLGFAFHEQGIQTSARRIDPLSLPISLVSPGSKGCFGLCTCVLYTWSCLKAMSVCRLAVFDNGDEVSVSL